MPMPYLSGCGAGPQAPLGKNLKSGLVGRAGGETGISAAQSISHTGANAMPGLSGISRALKGAELHLGDCMSVMEKFPTASIDMVLADLPYGSTRCVWDTPLNLDVLWQEYRRICRGPVVLFAQSPFDKVLGSSNLRGLRYEWIWEKTNATGHLNAKRAPMKAHENILVFCDSAPPYYPIKTTGHTRKTAAKWGDGSPVYGKQNLTGAVYDSTERYPRSVLLFPSDKQRSKLHPTQKPLALCEYLIRTHSAPDALVLDNCMGSGTTGLACINTGRRFIGIENDPVYFDVARARLGGTE